MKIRARLITTALVALVPMWIGIIAITFIGRASDRAKTVALMDEYTTSVTSSITSFFQDAMDAASYLAAVQGGAMIDWLGFGGGGDLFSKFVRIKDTIYMMSRIDTDGYVYEATAEGYGGNPWQGGRRTENDAVPDAAPIRVNDREYFRSLITDNTRGEFKTVVSEPYIMRGTTDKYFVTSVAVTNNGRAVGIVNAAQTSAELSRLYVMLAADLSSKFGENAHLFLFTEGGQLVSELRYNQAAGAYVDNFDGTHEVISLNTLESDYVSALKSAAASSGMIEAKMHGEAHFLTAKKIEGMPFIVCLAASRATMLAASRIMFIAGTVIFWLMTALMLVGMYFATRVMLSSLKDMDGTMHEIAKNWDLTAQVSVKGNDEITAIGTSVNHFVGSLNEMIGDVSKSAGAMSVTGETLSENAERISHDVSSIVKDIDNLNFAVEDQSSSVSETSATIKQIAQNIESLTRQIEGQSQSVAQISSSVQQMVANIGTIAENVSKTATSFEELQGTASGGRDTISAVQDLVSKLTVQSDSLLEANSVINNIASQTNLLAMNAAIEAAHAGEAGKGFSVVAEEIRKLAENSSSQSRTIAAGLKSTIEQIKNIAQATTTADGAFNDVATKINVVAALSEEVNLTLHEQNEGSRQVLEALRGIESVTVQIRDGAVEMNTGTETILKEIARLSNVSQQVQDRTGSIAKSAEAINGAVSEIVDASGANKDAIDVLVGVTGKFKL